MCSTDIKYLRTTRITNSKISLISICNADQQKKSKDIRRMAVK